MSTRVECLGCEPCSRCWLWATHLCVWGEGAVARYGVCRTYVDRTILMFLKAAKRNHYHQ
jgi:hypothetical protein